LPQAIYLLLWIKIPKKQSILTTLGGLPANAQLTSAVYDAVVAFTEQESSPPLSEERREKKMVEGHLFHPGTATTMAEFMGRTVEQ